MEQERCKAAGG